MSQDFLFRFVVMADSHVNPSEHDDISPYASHRSANNRLRHTVAAVNALRPALVMHVGDMIHPVPEAVSYPQAVDEFRRIMASLEAPLHLVPGNHDTGDKRAGYVPAGSIRADYVALYREHFGEHFFGLTHKDCRILVINTSLINSDLPEENEQAAWLETELAGHAQRRVFLFMHYPPYVAEAAEPGHYDNVDEPGRSWLLDLVARHTPAAVFTGHVHNFFFNYHGGTPIYHLPSTAFVRSDYAELFQVGQPAENENGRNDRAKLGFMVVDVHADRIVPRFIRTLDPTAPVAEPVQRDWVRLPPAAGALATLGLDLRYGWTQTYDIPYSSMLDEFRRKRARNDYPLLAMWEMGVRHARVPAADLLEEPARARMLALGSTGVRFTIFQFGWPDDALVELVGRHAGLIGRLELILTWPLPATLGAELDILRARTGVPVALSRFWNASGGSRDGKQIKLLVDHGFEAAQDAALRDVPRARLARDDALVFRVSCHTPARVGVQRAAQACAALATTAQVHVRLAADSPAEARRDEWSNAMRTLEAAFCSLCMPDTTIFLDTLSDVDRGYFPRTGLIDRLGNPRLAGRMLRNLNGALADVAGLGELAWHAAAQGLVGHAVTASSMAILSLPADARGTAPSWPADWTNAIASGPGVLFDLVDGSAHAVARPDDAVLPRGACLLIFHRSVH